MKHNFKELIVWKLGIEIAKETYKLTRSFTDEEKYVLVSQMRRAAISIPSNVAEGCGRGTDAQLIHFLDIALGSSCELETQFILSVDFQYISQMNFESVNDKIHEFQRRTRSFREKLVK